ncbi:unnamed protein product [Bursaphelenchus xylophilus]|uniref:(pine wood nematode) hypothetical protein n=1 Tax=Bursaphelenchus xylophilus TaxID=6326 RepID=A0A811LYQ6_BURXY|nr:unnamed protein product [Bursaphelenchus xylophilus]CAG9124797.1 unnamed protein product [Bursaphelenchus xylophilus]
MQLKNGRCDRDHHKRNADVDEKDLFRHVGHYAQTRCVKPRAKMGGITVKQYDSGEILIGKGFPFTNSLQDIKCYAREISGTLAPNIKYFRYVGKKIELPKNKPFYIDKVQFSVECRNKRNTLIYTNAFATFPKKKVARHQQNSAFTKDNQFSISILVLDSTSRNQFYRHAPKTLKFMKENGFKILWGYNKVADNSAVNLMPILTGMTIGPAFDYPGRVVPLNLTFLERDLLNRKWEKELFIKRVKELGYTTMWNDDIMVTKLGLFSYGLFKGFLRPPADFYFRPFYSYLYSKKNARFHCVEGELASRRYLKLWKNFALKFRNHSHFGFTFLTALTHDDPAAVGLLDPDIYHSLEDLKKSGGFENTIHIIMGDHGHRIRSIQKTYTGRLEERMPLFSIRFPKRFKKLYPEKVRKLEENQNRLVSNYDIHQTLHEVLFGDLNTKTRGTSLFQDIPLNRTCTDILIPQNHCTCMEKVEDTSKVRAKHNIATKIDALLSDYINSTTSEMPCVHNYTFNRIPTIKILSMNPLARFGVRFIKNLIEFKFQKKYRTPADNEIYLLETTGNMNATTVHNNFVLNFTSRFSYNRLTGDVFLEIDPFITLSSTNCKIYILKDLCKCQ